MQDSSLSVRLLQLHFSAISQKNIASVHSASEITQSINTLEEMALILVQKGNLLVQNQSLVYDLTPGQGLFLNCHQAYDLTAAVQDTDADLLLFNPSFICGEFDTALTVKYLIPFLKSQECRAIFLETNDSSSSNVLEAGEKLKALLEEKPFAFEFSCKEVLCRLFRLLLSYHHGQSSQHEYRRNNEPSPNDVTRINNAIAFFKDHYMYSISLEDIADAVHLSISECCRCFRRTVNASPIEYLNKYRVLESLKKIQAGDALANNISTLAYSVGFNSPSYYNKVFRRYLNCTPSNYKRDYHPLLSREES